MGIEKLKLRRKPKDTIDCKKKVYQSHYRLQVSRGFHKVKVPRLHDNGPEWWLGCQPYAPAAFTPGKYSWYSFLQ